MTTAELMPTTALEAPCRTTEQRGLTAKNKRVGRLQGNGSVTHWPYAN